MQGDNNNNSRVKFQSEYIEGLYGNFPNITGIKQAQINNVIVERIDRREANTSINLMTVQGFKDLGEDQEFLAIDNGFYNTENSDILEINKGGYFIQEPIHSDIDPREETRVDRMILTQLFVFVLPNFFAIAHTYHDIQKWTSALMNIGASKLT